MPVWTTLYLRSDEREAVLDALGIRTAKDGQWSESDRRAAHSHIMRRLRTAIVHALRDFCQDPNESEEQMLLVACFSAYNRGPNSIVNPALYQVPMQAGLSELRQCLGEAAYDEAIGYMGREKIYEEILGGIVLDDPKLQTFMASRFPQPLV